MSGGHMSGGFGPGPLEMPCLYSAGRHTQVSNRYVNCMVGLVFVIVYNPTGWGSTNFLLAGSSRPCPPLDCSLRG